ncbi:MAG: hypothetical protein LBI40_01790 [Treponema sp.]|nr:hypothetical protein [Treponema sp.]
MLGSVKTELGSEKTELGSVNTELGSVKTELGSVKTELGLVTYRTRFGKYEGVAMKTTAVIMAGGKGERFWPTSREKRPKQFHSLTPDGKTLLQLTKERMRDIVQTEDTFVVTNKKYRDIVHEQLPDIPVENILAEPVDRNTAPCVGFAASVIEKKYGDAVMIALPSDHLIRSNTLFRDSLKDAVDIAGTRDALVTIGIMPVYPETGYGYIHFSRNDGSTYKVLEFIEKPDFEKAKEYFDSGEYLWNSGMFVWKTSVILNEMRKFIPDLMEGLERIKRCYQTEAFDSVLEVVYPSFKRQSIDYGIMEKITNLSNVCTIPGSFGWNDVGSWLALERVSPIDKDNNVLQGNIVNIDCRDILVRGSEERLIALVGLEGVVVVDTDNALLICNKENTQDVKKVVEFLRTHGKKEFL